MQPIDEREEVKQRSEIEVWKRISAEGGATFYQETRPQGDLAVYADSVILDVGCGPRPFVEYFPAAVAGMFDCCMQGYSEAGLLQESSISRTLCADVMAEQLPVRDDCVDHVFAINMLDHTFDPPGIVREFRRVLKPWGYVHLNVDLGGEPNECEPVVFSHNDILELFRDFELIHEETHQASNVTRETMMIGMFRKPQEPGTAPETLALPHGRPLDMGDAAPGIHLHGKYLRVLRCPRCHAYPLSENTEGLRCESCERTYPVLGGVALLADPSAG